MPSLGITGHRLLRVTNRVILLVTRDEDCRFTQYSTGVSGKFSSRDVSLISIDLESRFPAFVFGICTSYKASRGPARFDSLAAGRSRWRLRSVADTTITGRVIDENDIAVASSLCVRRRHGPPA